MGRWFVRRIDRGAYKTSNWEVVCLAGGSIVAALGLIFLMLGYAEWYLHRRSADIGDTSINLTFVASGTLLALAVALFVAYAISRSRRRHTV